MIDAIDGLNSNSSSAAEYTPTFTHRPAAPQDSDSVVLSLDAQAKLLEQQGLNVTEIADQLGLVPGTVQADLGMAISARIKTVAA